MQVSFSRPCRCYSVRSRTPRRGTYALITQQKVLYNIGEDLTDRRSCICLISLARIVNPGYSVLLQRL